ncbi:MAG TPA: polymorphic toxin-type HINT domain-containing protein, partial [Pirellulales bacterium]
QAAWESFNNNKQLNFGMSFVNTALAAGATVLSGGGGILYLGAAVDDLQKSYNNLPVTQAQFNQGQVAQSYRYQFASGAADSLGYGQYGKTLGTVADLAPAAGVITVNGLRQLANTESAAVSAYSRNVVSTIDDAYIASLTSDYSNCFPAGTPVSTADGLRPIETIKAGDMVWAFDLTSASWKLRPVLETYTFEHNGDLVTVTVNGEEITATDLHPFWVIEGEALESRPRPDHIEEAPANAKVPGRWVDAKDLCLGDTLLLKDGRRLPVTALHVASASRMVYNLQVEDLHCYAVGTSETLVHNNSGNIVGRGPANLAEQLTMQDAQAGGGTVIMAGPFGDPLYQGPGWVKMQVVHYSPDGTAIVVHYMKNTTTGVTSQFKFKSP